MRNLYLFFIILFAVNACTSPPSLQLEENPFLHGVASGDPLPNAVVIWSRVTVSKMKSIEVKWEISKEESFASTEKEGILTTDSEKDFTLKADVNGLSSNTYYYYRFQVGGQTSPIGRTKTTPKDQTEQVRFGVVSCSNYEAGYFNAYARLAEKKNIDAVLHLGDYIYEYEPDKYGDTTLARKHLPPKEIVSLSDYQTRYAQYRSDKDLQKVHQAHPFIVIWDDHEITNNANVSNAENHQPEEEGSYESRKDIARKAYYNWMPIREGKTLYRQFNFGNLVDLVMLDERLAGRSEQVYKPEQGDYTDSTRTMLGKEQFDWFTQQIKASQAQWKIVGNQVLIADLNIEAIRPEAPYNMDAWDGYPAEKRQLLDFFADNQINNLVFVTGDTHCSWAFDIPQNPDNDKSESTNNSIAVELGTPGITSANFDESFPIEKVTGIEAAFQTQNPHLRYVDLHSQGYFILTINKKEARAEYFYVDKINEKSTEENLEKTILIKDKANHLTLSE